MSTGYRIHTADRDHQTLLDESSWESRQWYGMDDDDVRYGVSVCDSIEDLAGYVAQVGMAALEGDAVIVEVDGDRSTDRDHDADLGCWLILPEAITSVTPVTDAFHALVDGYLAAA